MIAKEDEWVEWHRGYAVDPQRSLRLLGVQEQIRRAIDRCPPGPIRLVSICAGDGRDVLGVLSAHPRAREVHGRLVDLSVPLVDAGRREIDRLGVRGIEFLRADAGSWATYAGAVPADIVLACGVFGNITDADVHATISRLPELCARGATVVWTRGQFAPDLAPQIRAWFAEVGFSELEFLTIPGTTSSVGSLRWDRAPRPLERAGTAFNFLPKADRPSQGGRAAAAASAAAGR